jgi:hypothetical protein
VICTAFAALMFVTFWYALPLVRGVSLGEDER